MVLGLILVNFMNRDSGVDDRWLNSLLLHNWLNGLTMSVAVVGKESSHWTYFMNVMVNMFASDHRCNGVTFLSSTLRTCILKLQTLLFQAGFNSGIIPMLEIAVFNGSHIMRVLLWQNFTIFDWLNGGVVMVLMDLAIDGSGGFLVAVFGDILVHDCGSDLLVNCGVMVTSLVPAYCGLASSLRYERLWNWRDKTEARVLVIRMT